MALALAADDARAFAPFRPSFYPMTFRVETVASNDAQRSSAPRSIVMFDPEGRKYAVKINSETGEITSRKLPLPRPNIKPRPRTSLTATRRLVSTVDNCIQSDALDVQESVKDAQDKSRIKLYNSCQMYLMYLRTVAGTNYATGLPDSLWDTAKRNLPVLIETIESVNLLDMGGNTRGLNQRTLLAMLEKFDTIDTNVVRDFMGCSERHAVRVAGCLRVIVNQFDRAFGRSYPQADR